MSGDVAAVKEVSPGYGFSEASALASNDIKQNQSAEMSANRNTWNLGDLSDFVTSGSRGWAAYYAEYGSLFIRSQNIKAGRLDFQDSQHVIPPAGAEGNRTLVRRGDILITITGNSVGNVAFVDREIGEAYISQHVGLIRLKDPSKADYICRFLSPGSKGNHQIVAKQSGQSKPGLTLQDLKDLVVDIPVDQEEQRAIATALSDVDALLEELDRLIAKKRDLKQATMQQLLTGQTRLPGFEGEWALLNMATHSSLKARIGWQGLTTSEYLKLGDYGLVTGTDFNSGRIEWHDCHFVERTRYDQDKNIQVKERDVLITKDGTIGKVAYIDHLPFPSTLNSGVFVIRPLNDYYEPKYLYYVLMSKIFTDFLRRLAAGSTISHLYQKDFVSFEFLAPPTKREQLAIASTISAIDEEIEALEQRHTKTFAIKQAMMQELLTGRTRLVCNDETDQEATS